MSAVSSSSSGERARYRLFGVAFILVAVLLAWLMVALYNKTFTPVYHVTLRSGRVGLQLIPHSDVKIRGLIVGEVREIDVTSTGAAIDLAIDPDKAQLIPRNVTARMLPKTIFGEKYVALEPPPVGRRERSLRDGDVIPQDHSKEAVEINQVLNDLMPLLRAVKPSKLNATLNAVATALQGRGEQIGKMIAEADDYLRKINKYLPTLVHDLKALGDVSANVNAAAPDLLQIMNNLRVTDATVVDKRSQLAAGLSKGIAFTEEATPFLARNENRLVGAMFANRKALALVAKYSAGIPCVFRGMKKLQPDLKEAMGGGQPAVHVTLELVKPRPGYKPGLDRPEYKDRRDPRCYGLPNPKVPFPQYQVLDGTEDDQWWVGRAPSTALLKPTASGDGEAGLKTLLGPALGVPSGQVSDIAALLYAPASSGMVVKVE